MSSVEQRVERTARAPGSGAPVVAAIDGSPASTAAIDSGIELAREFHAPLVFVYVRKGPAGVFGEPVYQRRLTRQLRRAGLVLDAALRRARSAGLNATAEVLEGAPAKRITEFAKHRRARAVVVGARDRRLRKSVSRRVSETAGRPVVIARGLRAARAAH